MCVVSDHQAMSSHGATSTHYSVGGGNHEVSPPVFGVVASWIQNLLMKQPDSSSTDAIQSGSFEFDHRP